MNINSYGLVHIVIIMRFVRGRGRGMEDGTHGGTDDTIRKVRIARG